MRWRNGGESAPGLRRLYNGSTPTLWLPGFLGHHTHHVVPTSETSAPTRPLTRPGGYTSETTTYMGRQIDLSANHYFIDNLGILEQDFLFRPLLMVTNDEIRPSISS
jgi:hypothetical protein